MEEIVITCACCGNTASYPLQKESIRCRYCRQPVIPANHVDAKQVPPPARIKQIALLTQAEAQKPASSEIPMALGLFYLTGGAYQYAVPQFKKAIENDPMNADAYFYLVVAMLGGKKAFLQTLPNIKAIVENLTFAEQLDPKAVYFYLHAYIAYDYYKRKFIGCSPSYTELLAQARSMGLSQAEGDELFSLLKTEKPNNF